MRYAAFAFIIAVIVVAGVRITWSPSHWGDSYSVDGGNLYAKD